MRIFNSAKLVAAALAASPAAAQAPAQAQAADAAAPAPAPPPICTTTTTVVRRGDVVLSTNSTTKCEDESAAGGDTAKAVFGAPVGALASLGKVMTFGGGDRATASNVRGDWKVMDSRARRVCHLFLTSQPGPAGFGVRRTDCRGAWSTVQGWTFEDGVVALHAADKGVVASLTGARDRLEGQTRSGDPVLIQR